MNNLPLILVVDDVDKNRKLVTLTLKTHGYRFEEAANGREAVDKALQTIPDLILMDIMMPEMDGFTAIKLLKENEATRRIPILVITALDDKESRLKALECGAMDFVSKPFDRHELAARAKAYTNMSLLNKKYILSTVNPVTGMPNRAALLDAIGEHHNQTLLVIKLDDFDKTRCIYGDATAAAVEKQFAAFFQNGFSEEFRHFRCFHIERGLFALLTATNGDEPHAAIGAHHEAIRDKLNGLTVTVDDTAFDFDHTLVAVVNEDNMLSKAELALDDALNNHVPFIVANDVVSELYQNIENNIHWLKEIKSCIQQDRVVPLFQPILCNRTGKIEKYEALMRLRETDGTLTPPGVFLPVIKNSRYYLDLTRIMLQKALQAFAERTEEVSVNLSKPDLESEGMREFILACLDRYPKAARRLVLELVEEEWLRYDDIRSFLTHIKTRGVKIAIDDFGSGYSNLKRLLELEVDLIKIDGSLIRNLCTDPLSRYIVSGIATLARRGNIRLVAEFVGDEETFKAVKRMGIDYSQGFFIGRGDLALPVSEG